MYREYEQFISSILLTYVIIIAIKYKYITKKYFNTTIKKIISFIKHIWSLRWVLISLFLLYKIFEYIYEDILPNIVTTAITVVIIDYLMKSREESSKKNLLNIFKADMNDIKIDIENLLKTILEVENSININEFLIKQAVYNMDFEKKEIKYTYIENDEIKIIDICKLDYIFYKIKEINFRLTYIHKEYRSIINEDDNKLIINVRKLLDERLFKIPISNINFRGEHDINAVKLGIIEKIEELFSYYKKMKY